MSQQSNYNRSHDAHVEDVVFVDEEYLAEVTYSITSTPQAHSQYNPFKRYLESTHQLYQAQALHGQSLNTETIDSTVAQKFWAEESLYWAKEVDRLWPPVFSLETELAAEKLQRDRLVESREGTPVCAVAEKFGDNYTTPGE